MRTKLRITLFLLLLASVVSAQEKPADKIIKRDGETIVCKVREVGDDEIKYVMDDFRSDVVFGIDKNKVASILFSDGRELKFSDSMFGAGGYEGQRKNAIKFNFFSPLFGASVFSFEHSLKPGNSIEAGFGIIGLGQQPSYDASGVLFNVGYKFIKDPDFYIKGMRYAHILKGAYFKPELAFSTYKTTENYYSGYYNSSEKKDQIVVMGALILNVGKQWVLNDRFLLDWYVGAGYGFGKDESDNARHFAFIGGSNGTAFVMNSGFRIGLLVK